MNTSNAIIPINGSTTTGNKKNRSNKSPRKAAPKWTLPVSKKFYERLIHKILHLLREIHLGAEHVETMHILIYKYLTTRYTPMAREVRYSLFLIFYCLKPEIDAAVERSAAARRRATERREAKNAAEEASVKKVDESSRSTATAMPGSEKGLEVVAEAEAEIDREHVKSDGFERVIEDVVHAPCQIGVH